MKENSQQSQSKSQKSRSQKIKQLKPKREMKSQQDIEYQKDLLQLIKLRQQNYAIRQAQKYLNNRIQQLDINSLEIRLQMAIEDIKQIININKIMLLQVLMEKPQIVNAFPNIELTSKRLAKSALISMQKNLSTTELTLCEQYENSMKIAQKFRQYFAELSKGEEQKQQETNQQTEECENEKQ